MANFKRKKYKTKEVSWGSPKYLQPCWRPRVLSGTKNKNKKCKVTKGEHEFTVIEVSTFLCWKMTTTRCKCGKKKLFSETIKKINE